MDLQTCSNCGREFDFAEEGFTNDECFVCNPECGKKLAIKLGWHRDVANWSSKNPSGGTLDIEMRWTIKAAYDHADRIRKQAPPHKQNVIVETDVANVPKNSRKKESSINRALHYASIRRGQGWTWKQLPRNTRWRIKWWHFWCLKPWGWVALCWRQKRIRKLERQLFGTEIN
jgi:DNA-directed RNA polymerase subunit RPC12/RpoP